MVATTCYFSIPFTGKWNKLYLFICYFIFRNASRFMCSFNISWIAEYGVCCCSKWVIDGRFQLFLAPNSPWNKKRRIGRHEISMRWRFTERKTWGNREPNGELLNVLRKSGKIKPGEVMYLVTLLEKVGLVRLAETVMKEGKTSILSLV